MASPYNAVTAAGVNSTGPAGSANNLGNILGTWVGGALSRMVITTQSTAYVAASLVRVYAGNNVGPVDILFEGHVVNGATNGTSWAPIEVDFTSEYGIGYEIRSGFSNLWVQMTAEANANVRLNLVMTPP